MKIADGPEWLESIANHPKVFPAVSLAGMDRISFGAAWQDCIAVEFDTGGWLFHCTDRGLYEVHTLFLPKSRQIREKAAEARQFMFCATDAHTLVTKVPVDLPHAKALTEAMGFRFLYRRENAWPRDSGAVAVDYFRLTVDEWIVGNPVLIGLGEWFHEQLGEAHVNHDPDPVHDAYAGFAVACGKVGMLGKGAWLYNRWARFNGFEPISTDNESVSFGGLNVRLDGDNLQVTENASCQSQQ